jgi:hypothetical protein
MDRRAVRVFVGGAELVRRLVRHRLGDGGRPGEGGSPDDDAVRDARGEAAQVASTTPKNVVESLNQTLDRTRSAHPLTTAETTPVGAWGDESGDGPDDAPSAHRRRQRRRPRARIDDAHSPATSALDDRSGDRPEDPLRT